MTQTTSTCLWNDSASIQELTYALEHGAVGATCNPVIVGEVLKKEMHLWKDRIHELIHEMPFATEDQIAWKVVEEISVQRILMQARLKPHRLERGLYFEPPQHAAVFCVDEKTAIQPLDRGLFVDAEHGRMLRRLQVQTAFPAGRFQSGLHQEAPHRYFFLHLPCGLVFCSSRH